MLLVDGALVTSLRDRSAMPRARALAARFLPDPTSATPVATQERAEKL